MESRESTDEDVKKKKKKRRKFLLLSLLSEIPRVYFFLFFFYSSFFCRPEKVVSLSPSRLPFLSLSLSFHSYLAIRRAAVFLSLSHARTLPPPALLSGQVSLALQANVVVDGKSH